MNYSAKLRASKIIQDVPEGEIRHGIEIGEENIIKMIDGFCTKDEIIGVPNPILFNLFDDYCKENNLPLINRRTAGHIMRKHFGVDRKKVRKGKELVWVYIPVYDGGKENGT